MNKKRNQIKAGDSVPDRKVKYQTRIYLTASWTLDLIPTWWKYFAIGGRPRKMKDDRPSFAIKFLIFTLHYESVKMNARQ